MSMSIIKALDFSVFSQPPASYEGKFIFPQADKDTMISKDGAFFELPASYAVPNSSMPIYDAGIWLTYDIKQLDAMQYAMQDKINMCYIIFSAVQLATVFGPVSSIQKMPIKEQEKIISKYAVYLQIIRYCGEQNTKKAQLLQLRNQENQPPSPFLAAIKLENQPQPQVSVARPTPPKPSQTSVKAAPKAPSVRPVPIPVPIQTQPANQTPALPKPTAPLTRTTAPLNTAVKAAASEAKVSPPPPLPPRPAATKMKVPTPLIHSTSSAVKENKKPTLIIPSCPKQEPLSAQEMVKAY